MEGAKMNFFTSRIKTRIYFVIPCLITLLLSGCAFKRTDYPPNNVPDNTVDEKEDYSADQCDRIPCDGTIYDCQLFVAGAGCTE